MFPENPFLQLVLPRARRALGRIQSLIWSEVAPVSCSFAGACVEPLPFDSAKKLAFKPVRLPFHWGRLFDQGWFHQEIPAVSTGGAPLYLHWDDQGEGTAYLDGVPYYGLGILTAKR
jgi:hypothetical protein